MDVITSIFNSAEDGDRIMISFPDIYSFYGISKWLSDQFGDPVWILWTDAAVERVNYIGKKYGFPRHGEAVVIGAKKKCEFLDVIERYEIFDDLSGIVKSLPLENRMIISFGVNFLELFGYEISKAVELLIEHERGVMCTCTVGEMPEKLLPFHDVVVEIKKSEDSFLSYHSYVAKLKFSMEGGVAEVSDAFFLKE
ncbi:hypothetical protein [Archaeoglobus sp.]